MSTPHNRAGKGDFARTVLMPGDPLRAKFIAEHFLEAPRLVTDVRGMLGFTGTYEGRPVSVMGSGMGMPSIGIYSYELYKFYDVDNIIRIGSAGSYTEKARLFDVVLATGAVSESSYARVQNGFAGDMTLPGEPLNAALRASAARQGIPLIEGNIHSSDVFYRQPSDEKPAYWERLRDERGCLAVEMESFALFANAQALGKNAACLVTISDSFVAPGITTAEQRQNSFTDMMRVALGSLAQL
jgi:purine-nucleoside phosphorylase